jgi:4-aminobutyrate aminotransferase
MAIAEPQPIAAADDLVGAAVPRLRTPLPGPLASAAIARDRGLVSPSMGRVHDLVPARARGCTIEDVDGNRFLDLNAGIAVAATGHCHPDVVAAIEEQSRRFLHYCSSDWYLPVYADVCERLVEDAPVRGDRLRVFLGNSGTEAVEAALKLARFHTGRQGVIAFHGSFHGRTAGSLSLTASKSHYRSGFGSHIPGVQHAPYGDFDFIDTTIFRHLADPADIAAIVVEPIQGEGGYLVPPTGWLSHLRRICDQHGILLVVDEVQSGIGRTGRMWALDHPDGDGGIVEADILLAGKGLASGLPLSAMIARDDLHTWTAGAHGSTFGGNPVACAAARTTIDLVRAGLADHAAAMGERFTSGLSVLVARHDALVEVRGRGLMIGLELVDGATAKALEQAAFHRGLLMLTCGPAAIRLAPPLVITPDEVDTALVLIEASLEDLGSEHA